MVGEEMLLERLFTVLNLIFNLTILNFKSTNFNKMLFFIQKRILIE